MHNVTRVVKRLDCSMSRRSASQVGRLRSTLACDGAAEFDEDDGDNDMVKKNWDKSADCWMQTLFFQTRYFGPSQPVFFAAKISFFAGQKRRANGLFPLCSFLPGLSRFFCMLVSKIGG